MFSVHRPAARPAPEAAVPANDNSHPPLLSEHDEPPPYATSESAESEEPEDSDDDGFVDQSPSPRAMPSDIKAILERRIDDDEVEKIAVACSKLVRPEDLYYIEAICEAHRMEVTIGWPRPEMFSGGRIGMQRLGILVRHNVKRRWEKLGIWNPNWGFAGRKLDASDDFSKWTWRWQPDEEQDGNSPDHYARALILRALRLRRNLLRGECAPVMPRSHLEQDVAADAAEAFLISRPCFLFQIEVAEEEMRFARLFPPQRKSYPASTPRDQVIEWWKERGDWRDEFYNDIVYEKKYDPDFYRGQEHGTVTSWKWRHESPSPEPESLTAIMKYRQCWTPLTPEIADVMKFSPEEVDELGNLYQTMDKRPFGTWMNYTSDRPLFPGQRLDRQGKSKERRAQQAWDAQSDETSSKEEEEELADPEPDPIAPPPPKRRRLRHHQPEDEANEPQPRRSTRVAGMKRSAEALPQETAPNKRTRTRVAAKATTPVGASSIPPPSRQNRSIKAKPVPTQSQPPQEQHTGTPVKRGRGRPRKGSGPSVRPSTGKKTLAAPPAPPAPVRAERIRASGANTSATPRPRGRPRKGSGPGTHPSKKNEAPTAPARARAGRAARGTAAGTDVPGVRKRRGRPRKSE